ncbi:hypothetical protein LCGC14_2150400, partial [marine sediment metagenome]
MLDPARAAGGARELPEGGDQVWLRALARALA